MWLQMTRTVMERSNGDPPSQSNNDKPASTPTPQTSQSASSLSSPSVVQAGEIMLILSLLLIFLVACFVALHFYLRSRKRKSRKSKAARDEKNKKNKKKKGGASGPPELHSQEKNIAEMEGTPVCEIGDSEPRHEMEDVEVPEVLSPIDEPIGSAISTFGPVAIPVPARFAAPEPQAREFAAYWSLRM